MGYEYAFAPMEGITTAPFRRLHQQYFPGIDRYYTPFAVANQTKSFQRREIRDILPSANEGIPVVPQILGNKADEVAWALEELASYGYHEINFNLGCSMPQIAKRGKGAGFLYPPDRLDHFFHDLFETTILQKGEILLTIKTRIGTEKREEHTQLLQIFNRYPFGKLIVHPRLGSDVYNNTPDMEVFAHWYAESTHPLWYNGDIATPEQVRRMENTYPRLGGIMIGRGLIRRPSLVREVKGEMAAEPTELCAYLEDLLDLYLDMFADPRQAVSKMKEIWWYLGSCYPDRGKELKRLKKCQHAQELRALQRIILQEGFQSGEI